MSRDDLERLEQPALDTIGNCEACGGQMYEYERVFCPSCDCEIHNTCQINCEECGETGCKCCLKDSGEGEFFCRPDMSDCEDKYERQRPN